MSVPRPEHAPVGKGHACSKCGLARERHRTRKRARGAYFKRYNRANPDDRHGERTIIAIDGEGYTRADGRHLYTYMAACDEHGLVAEVENKSGLNARQVFHFLCRLPKSALLVGFSLGYDRTKWVESWPDECVWRLADPDRRQGEHGPTAVKWDGYKVNLVATRMSIKETETGERRTVWDVWKFFQSSFVKALERWKVGTEKECRLIAREKLRRGQFRGIGRKEKKYCQLECKLLAQLVRSLEAAHLAEGLTLPSWYGPGSTASIILKEHGEQRTVYPKAMHTAVMCAYFGGRFECSRVGPVRARRLYAYDIASAYPAAMARLPCLAPGHGKWKKHARYRPKAGETAVVRFTVKPHGKACKAWGPLPHRLPDGNIVFPVESAGGWAWSEEALAGKRLHPGVTFHEAWVWHSSCDCPPPFGKRIRELYKRRLSWGKGARGLVLKLALNSLYGKSAQKVGKGRFRCMVRAGLITSMTRAALLGAVLLAKDPWNVLELATDSVLSRERLALESPGLGGWERKPWRKGAFLMRPGLRFSLDFGKEHTAARGVNPRILHRNRRRVVRQWKKAPMSAVTVQTPSFFHGARLCVRKTKAGMVRDPMYGRWSDEKKTLKYAPGPKRSAVEPDFRLTPWALPRGKDCASVPYDGVEQSLLADGLDEMRQVAADQPEPGMLSLV